MQLCCPWLSVVCACGAAFLSMAALGQSLSVVQKQEREFWIETATPPQARYVLQASANLRLWVDIHDDVPDRFSYRLQAADATRRFFRLAPWAPPPPPITIMLIGDSTVADLASNNYLVNGWGQGIYGYFKPDVRVINLAFPGYTTRVFLASAEKTQMVTVKPDFVLVQFGLIDEYGLPPHNTTLQEYGDNLRTIVQTIRGFDGTPILITPTVYRIFNDKGAVIPTFENRATTVKTIAAETQAILIDLHKLTIDLYNEFGPRGSGFISSSDADFMHFSTKGAQVVAGLVANALPPSLGAYLVGILDPAPKP